MANILEQFGIKALFHMTHIDNLNNILQYGLLAHDNPYQQEDISDCDVNNRRSRNEPIYYKSIHSYVPFYFNPKNNMLSRRRYLQEDIAILVFNKDLLYKDNILFTDANASTNRANFFNNLKNLNKLNWQCIYTKGYYNDFGDGGNKRMAEVLIPHKVEIDNIIGIITNNKISQAKIKKLTNDFEIVVDTKKEFYF